MRQFITQLQSRLSVTLPGVEAQYRMAPAGRKKMDEEALKAVNYRQSAVMVLICSDTQGNLFIPLIERHAYNGVHSGQVSLPGGKYEEMDGELVNTALRECYEEIGVGEIEVIGSLTELFIPVSSFKVQPFVGFCTIINPTMIAQEREVRNLIRMNINDLINENLVKQGVVLLTDKTRMKVPYFDIDNRMVWGATAMILNEVKELLKPIAY